MLSWPVCRTYAVYVKMKHSELPQHSVLSIHHKDQGGFPSQSGLEFGQRVPEHTTQETDFQDVI